MRGREARSPCTGKCWRCSWSGCKLIDTQIVKLNNLIAQGMKPHQEAVMRLAEVPGLGVDSAQQIIAEVGVEAGTFSSAAELTSWVGTCPGKDESAEQITPGAREIFFPKYLPRTVRCPLPCPSRTTPYGETNLRWRLSARQTIRLAV